MKQSNKINAKVLITSGLLLLAVIGVTIAAYTSVKNFDNHFTVGVPGVAIQEKFNPMDKWLPGEQKEKKVWFTNTGQQDMVLRFSVGIEGKVKARDTDQEPDVPLSDKEAKASIVLRWADSETGEITESLLGPTDFTIITEGGKDYYYYNKVLKGNSNDKVYVLHSVILNKALSNDAHDTNYSEALINLDINGEMILASEKAVREQWSGSIEKVTIDKAQGTVTWTARR